MITRVTGKMLYETANDHITRSAWEVIGPNNQTYYALWAERLSYKLQQLDQPKDEQTDDTSGIPQQCP